MHVLCNRWVACFPPDLEQRCDAAARVTLSHERGSFELSVVLVDDAYMRGLNSTYRKVDAPTNVLAFPCIEIEHPYSAESRSHNIGDIFIAYETTLAEVGDETSASKLTDHLAHLIVHGTLHLLGYDHETESEAAKMERHEVTILTKLGVADPYVDRELELGWA